jgi:D-tyrosyl-tRNA(Tyr) deacylase
VRALLQRISSAAVIIDGIVTGSIGRGLLVLLGVEDADTIEDIDWLAPKIVGLRIFPGEANAWERSVQESDGGILLVSQFTLHASTKKGTKPSWHRAAKPDRAIPLYEAMIARLTILLGKPIATGQFGAHMEISLVNDGPVSLVIDSKARE